MVSMATLRRILSVAMTLEIGFLGAGHMGHAILEGGLAAGLWSPSSVLVVDREPDRRARAAEVGCRVDEQAESLREVPVLVCCVRPQDFPAAAAAIGPSYGQLVISVMAGVESQTIADAFGAGTRVIRAMPNAPAGIGRGMTAIARGVAATEDDVGYAGRLFAGVGRTVQVDETEMCAVTAVSGSGPAWVYLLAEAIRLEAVHLGLSDDTADTLIRGTVEGAAAMLASSELSPAALCDAVTTPGGTTEAGLAAMRSARLVEAVRAGVAAACRRGEELAEK
jgi:pyrroline-5-carboxylate reductase